MTDTEIASRVEVVRAAEANLPAHQRRAVWAIEADLRCEANGHADFVDGRCVRCRAYAPSPSQDVEVNLSEGTALPLRCPHYTEDQGCPLHGETCAS